MDEIVRLSMDMETQSVSDNPAIVQIAAVRLWNNEVFFDERISPTRATLYGESSRDTMDWWDTQDAAIRNYVFGGVEDPVKVMVRFCRWCEAQCQGQWSNLRIYVNGDDGLWLRKSYERMDLGPWPFHYRTFLNIRVMRDIASYGGWEKFDGRNDRSHDALYDAQYQAKEVEHYLSQSSCT